MKLKDGLKFGSLQKLKRTIGRRERHSKKKKLDSLHRKDFKLEIVVGGVDNLLGGVVESGLTFW